MNVIDTLKAAHPAHLLGAHAFRSESTVIVRREGIVEVGLWLRDQPTTAFTMLMDLTCVDYLTYGQTPFSQHSLTTPSPLPYFMTSQPSDETWQRGVDDTCRFDVVYNLYSLQHRSRLRLKVPVTAEDPVVPSVTSVWPAANWYEREVWDMFGITFTGHPHLKRILMYEGFQGHPLRKDYPVNKRQPLIGPVN